MKENLQEILRRESKVLNSAHFYHFIILTVNWNLQVVMRHELEVLNFVHFNHFICKHKNQSQTLFRSLYLNNDKIEIGNHIINLGGLITLLLL